jgi:hypothetical protein
MKRRRLLLILLGSVASITLAILLWLREREPEFNGIPLSTWLERGSSPNYDEFARAIRHMGTNALPFLIRAAKYEEPRWRTWIGRTTSKWPAGALNSRVGQWLLGVDRSPVIAFGILGADADPALDELRRIQRDSKDPKTSERAQECIEFITERIGDIRVHPVPAH